MIMETGSAVLENVEIVESTQCDACGVARAIWKATSPSGSSLLFCGHHKTIHEAGLAAWAMEMVEIDSTS
jgi:hypothetical protein